MVVRTLEWSDGPDAGSPGVLRMIDQTLLPRENVVLDVRDVPTLVDAIRRLAVRGAPAIGVAAAYGVVLGVQEDRELTPLEVREKARATAKTLAASRPTAVNLFWALDRMVARCDELAPEASSASELIDALLEEAHAIAREDADQCRRMGELGASLLGQRASVLTHCNAGALATAGMGTALAPVYVACEQGKTIKVFADETRPLLQGARLTAWELDQAGVEVTVIADGAAASLMAAGEVDAVFVGSDRIALNGDVCNKIGTYAVALAAHHHGVPFYVVAPLTTFDPRAESGAAIPIEERSQAEVHSGFGHRTTPESVASRNPAFDVTPAALVTAIVTDAGIVEAPNRERVEALLRRAGRLA